MRIHRSSAVKAMRAFTLIEVMVSLAILGILLAIGLNNWSYNLNMRRLDSDYHAVGAILNLSRDRAKSLGSNMGANGACGSNPCATKTLVYVEFGNGVAKSMNCDAGITACATAATEVQVWYCAPKCGKQEKSLLDSYTLSPNDTISTNPAEKEVVFSPGTCGVLAAPICAPAAITAGFPCSGNAGRGITVYVNSAAIKNTHGGCSASRQINWDSTMGGVTLVK